jgi:hypothetical protein
LKDKLGEIPNAEQRMQVADVVLMVMNEAASSESFATQYWAANSILSIAEELSSQSAFGKAADLLARMLQTAARQPGWVQPEGVELQLKVLLARAAEGTGDLRTALQTYGQILEDNENLLDIQIGVARALQRSGTDNPSRLESAIHGAKRNPKTGTNVFWGWGKIGQVTSRKIEDFGDQFFEARFQLANCRWMLAASLSDAARLAELGRAERALLETHALYPELGGPDNVKRYDALLRKIQSALGKPSVGLGDPK